MISTLMHFRDEMPEPENCESRAGLLSARVGILLTLHDAQSIAYTLLAQKLDKGVKRGV